MFKVLQAKDGQLLSWPRRYPYTPNQPTRHADVRPSPEIHGTFTGYHLLWHAKNALYFALRGGQFDGQPCVYHAAGQGLGRPIIVSGVPTAVFTSVTVTTPYTGND